MRKKGCPGCGGFTTVDAVDNHGRRYRGCARCIIVLPRPVPAVTAPPAKPPGEADRG